MSRTARLEALQAQERDLRAKLEDVGAVLEAVEAGRVRFEHSLDAMQYSNDEMKGQYRILKERQVWAIGEQDKLRADLAKIVKEIGKMTRPGDSR